MCNAVNKRIWNDDCIMRFFLPVQKLRKFSFQENLGCMFRSISLQSVSEIVFWLNKMSDIVIKVEGSKVKKVFLGVLRPKFHFGHQGRQK
jgi:hypothetical protein